MGKTFVVSNQAETIVGRTGGPVATFPFIFSKPSLLSQLVRNPSPCLRSSSPLFSFLFCSIFHSLKLDLHMQQNEAVESRSYTLDCLASGCS